MAATSPQVLDAASSCYACLNASQAQLYRIVLLSKAVVAQSPGEDVSVNTLMAYGKCYACVGMSDADIAEISLLDMLYQGLVS